IIGVARGELSQDDYRSLVRTALDKHVVTLDETVEAALLARLHHVQIDVDVHDGWPRLQHLLKDRPQFAETVRVYYLAVGPALFGPITRELAAAGLTDQPARVVLEKPLGHDLASARAINQTVGEVFDESQIFRIDHYLGKESVQNLLVT